MNDQAPPDPHDGDNPGERGERPHRKKPDSRRAAVIGLLVTLLLVILGWIVVKVLGDSGRLQDCAMSGRTNCAPIEISPDR
jgi:hypothetical protein